MLDAAEHVLATGGIEEFTVAAVAQHAGMSVGTIYRRFTSKEHLLHAVKDQLMTRLEARVGDALTTAGPGLTGVLAAYTHAMADTFTHHNRIFPHLLNGQGAEAVERGLQALATIQDALADAAAPYRDTITRPDRAGALRFTARTITSSCVHRAATCDAWPDGLTWAAWAELTTAMAVAYLTAPPSP